MSPTPAVGWSSRTAGSDTQLVRGLALAGYRGGDGSKAVAAVFASYLTSYGVKATVKTKVPTPANNRMLARTTSVSVRWLLADMLAYSNNDYAEFLLRHAAKARGYTSGWRGARLNQRAVLARGGIPIARYLGYDGSGLSRSNRMPMETLTAVISALWNNPSDSSVVFSWGAIPVAGETGTLYNRFRSGPTACARGQIYAKTGTLRDVVGLAGIAKGADGTNRVFALLENGQSNNRAVRKSIDTMAATMVGCQLG